MLASQTWVKSLFKKVLKQASNEGLLGGGSVDISTESGNALVDNNGLYVPAGYSPTVSVQTATDDTYVLSITNKNGTIITPNLKGGSGSNGDDGKSVTASVNTNTDDEFTFTVSDEDGNTLFTSPNLKGAEGESGIQFQRLTQEQYDALPDDETGKLNPSIIYYIPESSDSLGVSLSQYQNKIAELEARISALEG